MESLSRLIVLLSLVSGGVAHAWLAGQVVPGLRVATAAAFVLSFVLARLALPLGLMPGLILAYTAPALLMVAFDVADYHLVVIWLALIAGPLVAASDWRRWHVPSSWRLPFISWTLIVAVTWPVIAAREVDFSLVAASTLTTPNGLLAAPPPLTAAWIISVALGQLVGLLWLDLLFARFGSDRRRRAERVIFVPLLASVTLSAAAAIYQEYVDIHWLNVGAWPGLDRAGGLMLDANSFGTAAAIWAPLALGLAWQLRRSAALGVVIMAVLALGVWASGSRTALLVISVGLCALMLVLARQVRAWQMRVAPVLLLVAAGAAVILAAVLNDDPTNPLARLLATFAGDAGATPATIIRELWTRNGYGVAAAFAISQHPWTGIGIGAFNPLSTDFAFLAGGAIIPPDNAQNWWRHQVAELGWLGALPSLWLSVVLIAALVRARTDDGQRDAGTAVRGVLIGIGLASLVGVGTQHPALFLTFVTIVYWFAALVHAAPAATPPARPGAVAWTLLLAWPFLIAGGQLVSAAGDLRVPIRATRTGFPFGYGFSAAAQDPVRGEVRWAAVDAVGVVPAQHAYFVVTASVPHPNAASDPVRVRLWRGTQLVADEWSTGTEPIQRILAVPPGAPYLMIETHASRAMDDGRALSVGGRWLRELPEGVRAEEVVP